VKVTERQQRVLDNLDRVTSDGARCETIYMLDGINISPQMRSLLRDNMIIIDDAGRLMRGNLKETMKQAANLVTVESMRALLLDEPTSSVDLSRLR
jgi:ABC-type phosphonate transport system ATPase subunit